VSRERKRGKFEEKEDWVVMIVAELEAWQIKNREEEEESYRIER
jgi:hypothetical protein